ncbi:PxxKW family cysteine-rich protein [Desulfosarcina sp. OttesenSCG-928-B08]|nr:PxxKW family cysteine-rich protein [Desulfosarcina sp. OttesenSCG-928-B08]
MKCTTIREGMECAFMTAKGCGYKNGLCLEIVDQCRGCNRTLEVSSGWYCSACPEPGIKWKAGNCNLATHVATTAAEASQKINPLKASKRSRK